MLDLNKLQKSGTPVVVNPSDRIFSELGNNTYVFNEILAEFIDNSIAARISGVRLNVRVEFFTDLDGGVEEIVISDNASGISEQRMGDAISPAGIQTKNSLNEHGLGMKQAVAALGELNYLLTKTTADTKARVLKEFRYGSQDVYLTDEFDKETGTQISIKNVKDIATAHPTSITTKILPYLGARYRRFLIEGNEQMSLIVAVTQRGGRTKEAKVVEVKPIYFHPSTRRNQPVIVNYPLKGSDWSAQLTFGYAPDEDELKELGLKDQVTKNHPYNVTLMKQGLDVILHDRVILFHQLSELEITETKHPSYNKIRGEIDLKKGFATAITKNSVIHDTHFKELIDQVSAILNGETAGPAKEPHDYLKTTTYPGELPEALLRDRLAEWLKTNKLRPYTSIHKEYVLEGIEGFIDILADEEAFEIKIDSANALSVYQLFMYMDIKDIKVGRLLAKEFKPGALVAAKKIQEKHQKTIHLEALSQYPINDSPNAAEREEYY